MSGGNVNDDWATVPVAAAEKTTGEARSSRCT
jgi:hypothetical protein